jgi:hypothetical protein
MDIVMDVVNQIDDLPIFVKWPLVEMLRSESVSMDDSDAEAAIISTLSGDTYHKLCSEPPLAQLRILPVSNQLPVRLGTIMIFSSNSQYGTLSRIIEPLPIRLGCESSIANMQYHCGRDYHGGDVLANSWIRYFGFDTDSVPSLISSLSLVFAPTKSVLSTYLPGSDARTKPASPSLRKQLAFSLNFKQPLALRIMVRV